MNIEGIGEMLGLTSLKETILFWLSVVLIVLMLILGIFGIWQTWQLKTCQKSSANLANALTLQNAGIDILKENDKKLDELSLSIINLAKDKRKTKTTEAEKIRLVPVTGQECADVLAVIDRARL